MNFLVHQGASYQQQHILFVLEISMHLTSFDPFFRVVGGVLTPCGYPPENARSVPEQLLKLACAARLFPGSLRGSFVLVQ